MKIAKGHQPVMPYLILQNAAAFIQFTKTVFNATEVYIGHWPDDSSKIEHAEMLINGCNIMIADVTENFGVANANLFMYVNSAEETLNLALQNGGTIVNELASQAYGQSAGFKDPFGNVWWLTSMK